MAAHARLKKEFTEDEMAHLFLSLDLSVKEKKNNILIMKNCMCKLSQSCCKTTL